MREPTDEQREFGARAYRWLQAVLMPAVHQDTPEAMGEFLGMEPAALVRLRDEGEVYGIPHVRNTLLRDLRHSFTDEELESYLPFPTGDDALSARLLLSTSETFVRTHPHDVTSQKSWALERSAEERKLFHRMRTNTSKLERRVPGQRLFPLPIELDFPSLGDVTDQLREMLIGVCFPVWGDDS